MINRLNKFYHFQVKISEGADFHTVLPGMTYKLANRPRWIYLTLHLIKLPKRCIASAKVVLTQSIFPFCMLIVDMLLRTNHFS